MSMAIASDADETSTGSSGNPVENEASNMLADSSGSNQLDCTVHHYYEKLKDFAFDMPGGWTDATISLFIDTFKQYKDDFSRAQPDELKIWQKIVKRCVERSNNHKVFTVNSVMELAGSLKSHVLRNEYRKDDETFKMLYNDVVDIIPYFPNTTCDSISQNLRVRGNTGNQGKAATEEVSYVPNATNDSISQSLRLRTRSNMQDVQTFTGANDGSSLKNNNIDNLIIKYCEEMNLSSEKYCSNLNWNNISKKIFENHGIRVDVKKHLGSMKRKLAKDLKGETDSHKKSSMFLEVVGLYQPYFDLMPPRNIKTEEFIDRPTRNGMESSNEKIVKTVVFDTTNSFGPKMIRKGRPKMTRAPDAFPKIRKIMASEEYEDSSESDEPIRRQKINSKNSLRMPLEDESSDIPTSPETNYELEGVQSNRGGNRKQSSPKKSINSISGNSKVASRGRVYRALHSTDDESSPDRVKAVKRPLTDSLESPPASPHKSVTIGPHNSKNSKISDSVNVNKGIIMKTQAKVELEPLKVRGSAVPTIDSNVKGAKKSENAKTIEDTKDRRIKKPNFDALTVDSGSKVSAEVMEINTNCMDESQPEAKGNSGMNTLGSFEKVKSNIVTPINVKVSEQIRQEASSAASSASSNSDSSSFAKADNSIQSLASNSVAQGFNSLDGMEESTVRIVEVYKEKLKDTGRSVMQLIPKQHSHIIQPVGVATTSASDTDYAVQTLSMGKPPGWFDAFLTDYKKHEMWKMHQLLKMQQELVDMENRKLKVLEKIVTSLNDRKS